MIVGPRSITAANVLMAAALTPFAVSLIGMLFAMQVHGGDALGAVYLLMIAFVIAYLAALVIGFPAALWSYWMFKTRGLHARGAGGLRIGVYFVTALPFIVFPALMLLMFS